MNLGFTIDERDELRFKATSKYSGKIVDVSISYATYGDILEIVIQDEHGATIDRAEAALSKVPV